MNLNITQRRRKCESSEVFEKEMKIFVQWDNSANQTMQDSINN